MVIIDNTAAATPDLERQLLGATASINRVSDLCPSPSLFNWVRDPAGRKAGSSLLQLDTSGRTGRIQLYYCLQLEQTLVEVDLMSTYVPFISTHAPFSGSVHRPRFAKLLVASNSFEQFIPLQSFYFCPGY